jgi:hypothetical protein
MVSFQEKALQSSVRRRPIAGADGSILALGLMKMATTEELLLAERSEGAAGATALTLKGLTPG